jgi:NitT/TauT family transport system substrate-binding protein
MKVLFQHFTRIFALLLLLALFLSACGNSNTTANGQNTSVTVHLGYFPNITHAAALVGVARGTFAQALAPNKLSIKTFNAGPDLMQALLAGDIDIGYAGPSPAVNAFVQSHGDALRIIAGASSNGVEFVVRPGAHIQSPSDLQGKKIAVPQLGGTQDISLLHYLQKHNLKPTTQGGNVQVIPADNSTIVNEFKQGQIDGAWVPEPYASTLVSQDNGTVFVNESTLWPNNQFATTIVVARKAFLDQHPDIVQQFLQAHVETVQYINTNLPEAKKIANTQIKTLTGKSLSTTVLDQAFKNLTVTYDPLASTVFQAADNAYNLGYLGTQKPDLTGIFDLTPLNTILSKKGLPKVSAS